MVHAWFPRAQGSPESCPKRTLSILEFLSEWQPFIRMGWDSQGVAGVVPTPSHPQQGVGVGNANPGSWKGEDRGRGVSLQCFPGKQPFRFHLCSSGL